VVAQLTSRRGFESTAACRGPSCSKNEKADRISVTWGSRSTSIACCSRLSGYWPLTALDGLQWSFPSATWRQRSSTPKGAPREVSAREWERNGTRNRRIETLSMNSDSAFALRRWRNSAKTSATLLWQRPKLGELYGQPFGESSIDGERLLLAIQWPESTVASV
jgi:hypothetical protein